MSFNLSFTAQELNASIAKANAAAPQTTTYAKNETNALLAEKADLVDGKVPSSQLPSYVDDVLEYAGTSAFPVTGESGKIYVATDTNKTYRWGGSAYVEISESLALGETASTAYPGNKGKANADAIAKKPGEITTGKQYVIDGETVVTAGFGAEAFNNLASNKASGLFSHAEGVGTTAFGMGSHAEGASSTASGSQSHAEGAGATASGGASHAEGSGTTASGTNSHAEGYGTTASSANQHVQGKYNVEDANNTYAFIIGNGTGNNARHNAFAIDWNGLIYVNGAATGVDVSALAPQSTTYTKNEVDTALAGKANTSDLGAAAAKGFDASPTSGNANNAVSSDGVYQALSQKAGLDVVEHYLLSSSKPVVMDASRYSMFFVFGLAQGIGRFTAMLFVNTDDTVSWTMYGNSTQPSNITASYNSATHKLTMQSSNSGESKITVVKCIV